ncbi:glycosyltransferase family 2 protein [Argonema antarcticum]|uniref:glycosyltransferase family 2 protein n=1 Tax=Argonema antarcticum TaxID=2942763 RepID=UPI002011C1E0|nr:glycosyltransferase family 2 protein [Argonema antarcticum]MCL1470568.1 glycosyltransferase family 2 protein [Argonema antarcticum A004/B2]
MSISTPIAFFIFNRPALTEIVFEAIAKAKPKKLLIVADGPRFPEEDEKCQKARAAVIDKIDWECEVLTNFSEKNRGCKYRVSSGLDWVFSEVEEAIILEDDCLPDPSFFGFCETMLNRYRNDERVMMISGDNFQLGNSRTEYSYYFSKYTHIWGWASWRRAWQHYDVEMKSWPEYKKLDFIYSVCEDPVEQKYWTDIFDLVFDGGIDTWDYQWLYTCWCQNGLTIIPNCNLISNIGFGNDGTHTCYDSPWAQLPINDISEIKHPPFIFRHREADSYTFEYLFGGKNIRESYTLINQVRRRLSSIKGKLISCF